MNIVLLSKKQYNLYMANNDEIKKQIDFLHKRILKIEKFLQNLNFRPYSAQDMKFDGGETEQLFEQAVRIVCAYDKASSSLLQRRLSIGFNRAARLIEQLEEAGVVSPAKGAEPRDVLIKDPDEFLKKKN